MKLAAFVSAAVLFITAAAATEIEAPHVTLSHIDWAVAAATLPNDGNELPALAFARLNVLTDKRFPGIAKSSVPVLLPIDIDAYCEAAATGLSDTTTSDKYFGGFHPSKFFLPGPAGYDATFFFNPTESGSKVHFQKPIEVEITGAAFVYDLDGPDHQEVFPAHELEDSFPGIRRIFRDAHVRYAFERFGVPYVESIQCYDRRTSARHLSWREADPVAVKFLRMLRTAGGTPKPIAKPHIDLSKPAAKSDFTYYSPGDLIPDTGWHKMGGGSTIHVYARVRFPIAKAPAYVKSQSFMPWGDCYRSGHTGTVGLKDAVYACKVNGIQLVFDESASVNFTYPWRDNFCELRNFIAGQCPGGYGHQGEDIRPANCVLFNEGAERCLPYQHSVAAVRTGMIKRSRGKLAAYIVVNTKNDFVRFRYLHMNPKFMDEAGLLSGRRVSEGDIIGKVATWGQYRSGTSYHLHFDMQVLTEVGWVWVNPYMTLVLSYEHLIGGRGIEINPGEPAPRVPSKAPMIEHPSPIPLPRSRPPAPTRTPVRELSATMVHKKPHQKCLNKEYEHSERKRRVKSHKPRGGRYLGKSAAAREKRRHRNRGTHAAHRVLLTQ